MARYYSKYANFTANVLKERIPRHPVTGDLMIDQKVDAVRAEFGEWGPEVDVPLPGTDYDADGNPLQSQKGAVMRGHYFDSEIAQKQKGWTDEQTEAVVRRLDYIAENMPSLCERMTEAKAEAPWPTYDTMHHNSIAGFAQQAGMIEQAMLYERQNKNREHVLQQLQEKQAEAHASDALTAV